MSCNFQFSEINTFSGSNWIRETDRVDLKLYILNFSEIWSESYVK